MSDYSLINACRGLRRAENEVDQDHYYQAIGSALRDLPPSPCIVPAALLREAAEVVAWASLEQSPPGCWDELAARLRSFATAQQHGETAGKT
jgi:hypothetical protein